MTKRPLKSKSKEMHFSISNKCQKWLKKASNNSQYQKEIIDKMMAAKNLKKKKKVNKTNSDNGDQREILKKENKFRSAFL